MREFSVERLGDLLAGSPANTVWRHDVDVSPAAALKMADLEADLGIEATFYVMTSSPFYTPSEAFELALALFARGHRVGRHLDRSEAVRGAFTVGVPVSFHCPTEYVLWRDFAHCENAYASRWQGRYMSDARGVFRDGDPEDRWDDEPFQVALHPEWWFEPDWLADRAPFSLRVYEGFFYEPAPVRVEVGAA